MVKKFWSMIFALSIIFSAQINFSYATDKKPVRLARLPIIFMNNQPDLNTCKTLEVKLSRAVHVPMNNTLRLVDYVGSNESSTALNEIWQELRAKDKKIKLKDTMKPLAKKINADIIVCPVLRRYSEVYYQKSFGSEGKLVSNVSATLIIYDRRTDELIEKKDSRSFNSEANRFGKASYLAEECFDRLIDATKIRQKVNAIK